METVHPLYTKQRPLGLISQFLPFTFLSFLPFFYVTKVGLELSAFLPLVLGLKVWVIHHSLPLSSRRFLLASQLSSLEVGIDW